MAPETAASYETEPNSMYKTVGTCRLTTFVCPSHCHCLFLLAFRCCNQDQGPRGIHVMKAQAIFEAHPPCGEGKQAGDETSRCKCLRARVISSLLKQLLPLANLLWISRGEVQPDEPHQVSQAGNTIGKG